MNGKSKVQVLNIPLIEFVYESDILDDNGNNIPQVITVKAQEITGISQLNDKFCLINLLDKELKVYGTHRTLSNRWVYCLEKTHVDYYDNIIRPSTSIYLDPTAIIVNDSFLDEGQVKAFIKALSPELLKNKKIMDIMFGYDEYNDYA